MIDRSQFYWEACLVSPFILKWREIRVMLLDLESLKPYDLWENYLFDTLMICCSENPMIIISGNILKRHIRRSHERQFQVASKCMAIISWYLSSMSQLSNIAYKLINHPSTLHKTIYIRPSTRHLIYQLVIWLVY